MFSSDDCKGQQTHRHIINTLNHSLNITLPPPPPGFSLQISYNSESRLNPLAVYHNTILTLYKIANQYSWTQIWTEPITPFSIGWQTWILVIKKSGRRLPPLMTSYVVLALYHGVAQMSEDSVFCQMVIEMFVNQALIGNVTIENLPNPPAGVAAEDEDGGRVRNGNESAVGLATTATNSSDSSLGIVIHDVDMRITYNCTAHFCLILSQSVLFLVPWDKSQLAMS